MFLDLIAKLGSAFMWVCGIKETPPLKLEDFCFAPSEGRSFINYDGYDPDLQHRLASETWTPDEE